jgi:hypothetical protein
LIKDVFIEGLKFETAQNKPQIFISLHSRLVFPLQGKDILLWEDYTVRRQVFIFPPPYF